MQIVSLRDCCKPDFFVHFFYNHFVFYLKSSYALVQAETICLNSLVLEPYHSSCFAVL